jgi:hypothetical protein
LLQAATGIRELAVLVPEVTAYLVAEVALMLPQRVGLAGTEVVAAAVTMTALTVLEGTVSSEETVGRVNLSRVLVPLLVVVAAVLAVQALVLVVAVSVAFGQ